MTETIKLLIADDHQIVLTGLKFLMATEPDFEVIDTANEGEEALSKILEQRPDVCLLDLQMPKMSGIEVIRAVKESWPEARILVLTSFTDDANVFDAIKAGALGYLLKDSTPGELISAIRSVARGDSSLHPKIARRILQEINRPAETEPTKTPLTERELEVLKLVSQGMTNQDIADRIVISERTVRAHVSAILDKLHLANRTQAALYALREGYASLADGSEES